MACLSATLLNSRSWTARVHGPHHLYPNRPNHTFVVSMNGMVHSMREHTLLKASLSSSYIEVETAKKEGVLTLQELCQGHVPEHIICRMEEVGYVVPTKVQQEALPVLFAGCDCVLHAQTGSGKTLAYLLRIFSVINTQRSAVQALIVVPTRELGIQVTKVARVLSANSEQLNSGEKSCTIMALLDGGTLKRHKSWLKAEPPTIVIATLGSLTQMLEKNILKLDAMQVLVIDEVCSKGERYLTLLSLLKSDEPHSAIVFVGVQSEKSKKAGDPPPTTLLVNFLKSSLVGFSEISLLEEDMNFNQRAASLTELQQGSSHLLVATDIAARGVDLPGTTHIYNFNLPKDAVNYLHRAGRAGRKPFSDEKCYVTSIITPQEQFVLQRFENELMFSCEQLFFDL
ncbi:PREDICTED: DEAD-box ATP-dependent RNA helicase 58, chloroplastic isoform X3 [Ipomoea nil]|uniref:DEAD-box ATP-dependent RNA helicase 58, chloroplastic isoform X3 n=1 Tax=Ipomoea nil TaxID=35883 RepID=UPI0009008BFE|nr:PREDICTED: DEAD-box ATP-dependent RNA helicase 58, chloroplastic isoform X3 [Ipomoea nil]